MPTHTDDAVRFSGAAVPDEPLVSVVTPAFDAAASLPRALASVDRAASLLSLEHVVADGGSRDGTLELLRATPFVRGISRPDGGLYHALDWALGAARGPYVQWLNADDELSAEFLVAAVALLEQDPSLDLVVGATVFVAEGGRERYRWRYDLRRAFDPDWKARGYFLNLNSMVARRAALLDLGPFADAGVGVAADRDMEMRMMLAGMRGATLDAVAYRFHVHGGSLTSGEGAALRLLRDSGRLYEKWSRDQRLPRSARDRLARRALELRIGLGLKELRHRRSATAGVARLAGCLRGDLRQLPGALADWAHHRLRGDIEPMRVDPAT